MLKKFSVKNYKGFKEELLFDFSNVKRYTFNNYAIKNDLINASIIYGKNGSGKSNFGLALFDITYHLTDFNKSLHQGSNYLNGNSDELYATFNYEFLIDGINFAYTYKKIAVDKLQYESLFIENKKVFSYNFETHKGDFSGMDLISAENLKIDEVMNLSILRFITFNANITAINPISKLMNFIRKMLWFRTTTDGNEYLGYKTGSDTLTTSIIQLNKVKAFETFLNQHGLKYTLEAAKAPNGLDVLIANFEHQSFNFIEIASHGTKALLLYYYWMLSLEQASFVFIDEFDAFFHTSLGETLILELAQKNSPQIMITTHNTSLMSNNILRPDCYFIISNNAIKSLPNATERELREGHNLEKMYLSGAFNEQ